MRITILVIWLLLVQAMLHAQKDTEVRSTEMAESNISEIPSKLGYKELRGIGIGTLALRDEATSPLVYRGIVFSPFRAKVKRNENYETIFGIRPLLGFTITNVNSELDFSGFFGADLYYTYLRNVPKLTFSNIDVKLGGTFDFTTISRINPSFQNNSVGFDLFPTLMGSIKLQKSFIGKSLWGENLSIMEMFRIRKPKPRVHQEISFQVDVGIINANFRNGYAYTIHAPFYNNRNLFSDHEFNWFSGFRIRSNISYIVFSSKTKNGIKFTYMWEGVRSGRNPDLFAFTNATIQFSLIHRLY